MPGPNPLPSLDVLWLGASAADGSLRPAEGSQRRGAAVTTLTAPAGLSLADGGAGAAVVVLDLRSEQAADLADPEVLRTVLDAVAPQGAARLVAEGPEQTRLLTDLLDRWPAGWSFEQVRVDRGSVSATVRRAAPDDVLDQEVVAQQLWVAVDRLVRELDGRDQQAWSSAQRVAARERQLEDAMTRELEAVAQDHELLDEITQLRALVKHERRNRARVEAELREVERTLLRRAARFGRRTMGRSPKRSST